MTTTVSALETMTIPGQDDLRQPRVFGNSFTMAWRALLKARHEPELVADAIGIPVLFTLLFTYLFGGALSGSPHEYLRFLLPGTLVMTILLITVSAGLSLNNDRNQGALDRFRSMPVWQPALIIGSLIGDLVRYLVAAALVLGLGLLMGYRPAGGIDGILLAVALILVFGFSVSWIWTSLGLVLRSAQAVSILSFTVQVPLSFASNVFVNPATLPGWLHAFVNVNPVSHLVTAERALMNGTAAVGQVGWVLLASAGLIAVFGPLTMMLYRGRQ
ncbi:MAG TPA: ABC transporter permease [Streptosporangiaceae bacterium]|nr:ABC transporter permease [Streptosporangiaceae bacterium]